MSTYPRPARLLTQNQELRRIGVWNWTLPAWAGRSFAQWQAEEDANRVARRERSRGQEVSR